MLEAKKNKNIQKVSFFAAIALAKLAQPILYSIEYSVLELA